MSRFCVFLVFAIWFVLDGPLVTAELRLSTCGELKWGTCSTSIDLTVLDCVRNHPSSFVEAFPKSLSKREKDQVLLDEMKIGPVDLDWCGGSETSCGFRFLFRCVHVGRNCNGARFLNSTILVSCGSLSRTTAQFQSQKIFNSWKARRTCWVRSN